MRAPDWDAGRVRRATTRSRSTFLAERCDRVLLVTIPLDLGRPRAGGVAEANAIDRGRGRERGALVLDLRDFGARNLVMADHVHPTAFGQVWIAERALDVLAADGMDVRVRPSTLIRPASARGCARCRATGPTSTGALKEQARALGCRGSGAPSCSSRFGT